MSGIALCTVAGPLGAPNARPVSRTRAACALLLSTVMDVIYLSLTAVFFAVSLALVELLDRL